MPSQGMQANKSNQFKVAIIGLIPFIPFALVHEQVGQWMVARLTVHDDVSARPMIRAEARTAAVKAKKRPKSRAAGKLVVNSPGTVV